MSNNYQHQQTKKNRQSKGVSADKVATRGNNGMIDEDETEAAVFPVGQSLNQWQWQSIVVDENGHRYVGLQNQGATCYLNTILQMFYMTPEFRNLIYNCKFNGNEMYLSCQLQKLFVQLQTSEKHAVSTKSMTNTFPRFRSNQQWDVPDGLRKILEKLGKEGLEGPLRNLYTGKMDDRTKCSNCNKMNSQPTDFIELTLVTRNQYGKTLHSLEECLQEYVAEHPLDTGNSTCNNCGEIGMAVTQLKITELPEILTLHILRNDYDPYGQGQPTFKSDNRITFPDFMDLNNIADEMSLHRQSSHTAAVTGQWLNASRKSNLVQQMLERGKYIYELFAVAIHQGATKHSGHWLAYIKNMETEKWQCFNDSFVYSIGGSNVQNTFSNAHLLLYRRIDSNNAHFLLTADLRKRLLPKNTYDTDVDYNSDGNMPLEQSTSSNTRNSSEMEFSGGQHFFGSKGRPME